MTRQQELKLIEIGLDALLKELKPKRKAKRGRKWTKEQHKKFAKSMTRTWAKKRAKNDSIR